MNGPSYPAARAVAERIQTRLATNNVAFKDPGDAPKPDAVVIEEVISAAFWASLRREEGKPPKISLAFVPPEQAGRPLMFAKRLRLAPEVLTRLAPAVEGPGVHIGVWWYGDHLCIWGTTHNVPTWCFVLEVVAPGLLVVKYRRPEPLTKFANVAVLEGASIKFLKPQDPVISEQSSVLSSLLAFYASAGHQESDNILVRVAISMRNHGRGGTLLVVPRDSESWKDSVGHPIPYLVTPASPATADLADEPEATRSVANALGGPTAVDGATVINDHLELLAFGVKIVQRDGRPRVERVLVTEPVEGSVEEVVVPSQLGNTRHLSAAQFVNDQREAIALVASQDGRFTVFAWSAARQIVHAHRLEALLL